MTEIIAGGRLRSNHPAVLISKHTALLFSVNVGALSGAQTVSFVRPSYFGSITFQLPVTLGRDWKDE
jgi:hypothetical protein